MIGIRIFALFLFMLTGINLNASTNIVNDIFNSKYIIVKDYETSTVLFEKNANARLYPASITKLMTIYITFQSIKNNVISFDTRTKVSKNAFTKGHYSTGNSSMFLKQGQEVSVEDLIKGDIVVSGNDASIVLAELLAGSEENFVKEMNIMAEKLGLKDTHFTNAYGIHDSNHYSTAEDLTILSQRLIADFPEYYYFFAIKSFEFNGVNQNNRNPLLFRTISNNIVIDGLKTGHTDQSKYSLAFSATNNENPYNDNFRIVGVISGASSEKQRSNEADLLIRNIYSMYNKITLFTTKDTITTIPILNSFNSEIQLKPKQSISFILPKKYKISDTKVILTKLNYVVPPRAKGSLLATIEIVTKDKNFDNKYTILLDYDIDRVSFVSKVIFAPYYAIKKLLY